MITAIATHKPFLTSTDSGSTRPHALHMVIITRLARQFEAGADVALRVDFCDPVAGAAAASHLQSSSV
jgi:hypothetical protein